MNEQCIKHDETAECFPFRDVGSSAIELPAIPRQGMSTLEIAELFGKKHQKIMKEVRQLSDSRVLDEIGCQPADYTDGKGKKKPMYNLNFKSTIVLLTGHDIAHRTLLIDRWMELEKNAALFNKPNIKALKVLLRMMDGWFDEAYTEHQKTSKRFTRAYDMFNDAVAVISQLNNGLEAR